MTEDQLLAEVTALCDRLGLLWHHDPDSRRSKGTKGFPDLVIAGPHGIIFAELKSEDGDTSADQDRWLWTLGQIVDSLISEYQESRIMCFVWRPADLASGLIKWELEALK